MSMASGNFATTNMTGSTVQADLASCRDTLAGFSSYCDELLNSVKSYSKLVQKKKKKGKKNVEEPIIVLPPRPSGRPSLNVTNMFDPIMGAGTRSVLAPIPSEDEPSPSADCTRGNRTHRAAALKAREGCKVAYQPITTKLRRPSNFDPRSGPSLQDTTHAIFKISSKDVFKKPALPIPAANLAPRESRSRATRSTTSSRAQANDEEEPDQAALRPSRSTRNKTKIISNVSEPAESSEEEAPSRPPRATRTGTKARQEDAAAASNEEFFSADEEVAPKRTRSRMLTRVEEPSPGSSGLPRPARRADSKRLGAQVDSGTNATFVLPTGSVESIRSSRDGQLPRGTYVVPNEADDDDMCNQSTLEHMETDEAENAPRPSPNELKQPSGNEKPQNNAISNTTSVLKKRPSNIVDDPMETLELPDGVTAEAPEVGNRRGSLKRQIEENVTGPALKRVRSAENVSAPSNDSGVRAPRTRSKARNLMAAPAEISRSGAANKENSLALPIDQIMKSLTAEKSNSRTPGKAAPKAVQTKIPKKEKDDVLRRKEEEALKKKQELMNQKKEEIRKNREIKVKKVAESRAAVEKEKMIQLEREKKEREEKERQAMAELQRKREEELQKKKMLNQQKAQEAEERRIREEKIRLARLREQEEEQRRAAEARQRQLEEAERLAALRKAQEKEDEQLRALEKERREREKARTARAIPAKEDPDDIGIDDADGDESAPRRPVPEWAEPDELNAALKAQSYLMVVASTLEFFGSAPLTPNLKEMFGNDALPRPRTSSQFWPRTPPNNLSKSE